MDRFALHSHRTYLWYKLSIMCITELGRFKWLWRQISNRIDDIVRARRPRPYGQIVVYLTERKLELPIPCLLSVDFDAKVQAAIRQRIQAGN